MKKINIKFYKLVNILRKEAYGNVYLVENIITDFQLKTELQTYLKVENPSILTFIVSIKQNLEGESHLLLIVDHMKEGSLEKKELNI